jgi:hypothetical protein
MCVVAGILWVPVLTGLFHFSLCLTRTEGKTFSWKLFHASSYFVLSEEHPAPPKRAQEHRKIWLPE